MNRLAAAGCYLAADALIVSYAFVRLDAVIWAQDKTLRAAEAFQAAHERAQASKRYR